MTDTIEIHPWTNNNDISFAKSMTDIEQWGNSENDFRRLQKIQPDGCFIATQAEQRVGMITALAYGLYGFLGSLIVTEQFRGQGLGERLMRHAIEFLKVQKVTTIELDGEMQAVPLYRRLGFKDKYHSLRFQRPANAPNPEPNGNGMTSNSRKLISTEIEDVIRFDRDTIGYDRSRVLNILSQEFPDSFYGAFDSDNNLIAYLCARPISETSLQLGPLMTKENSAAIDLLSRALKDHPRCKLSIGLPASATYIAHWILRQGFVRLAPSMRMYLGDEINYEQNIACILSPEKG